jgi:hypothetical protein
VVTEKERRSDGEWLGKHRALYHALPAFTEAILRCATSACLLHTSCCSENVGMDSSARRAVRAEDVPMEPRRAIVVVRGTV